MNLLVFVKYPHPGQVKTRLAAQIGANCASDLYRACVADLLGTLDQADLQATMYCAPNASLTRYKTWLGPQWTYQMQQGTDLGQRMASALLQSITPGQATILIGSDLPDLPAKHILAAQQALHSAPLCLGPALDGGFYLIGLNTALPLFQIFADVTWSSSQTLTQVMANCHKFGLSPALIPPWPDLDSTADIQAFMARQAHISSLTRDYIRQNNLEQPLAHDLGATR